ncbi:MAG: sugar phosphate isomerase/epimerase [Bacteroidetes bacterium]|nr:sugar phosphate isomerase/epimerase [Bacteroidota bacterium]
MNFQVYQSYWGMTDLPYLGQEWTREEKVAKIAEAGFDGVEFMMEEVEHRNAMVPLCEKHNLKRANIVFPWNPEEFKDDIKAAQEGGATHINLQPMPMPRTVAAGVPYIVGCMDLAAAAGIPLFIETHRDRMTTDMYFTLDLIEAVPDMVLCGDLSHFLVGREFAGPPLSEQNEAYMTQIIERCGLFHGRVASREQVQVPISFPHNKVWLDLFAGWWEQGFKHFKANAPEDATLTFVVELGPATYAIQGADGNELSDRWAEAIQIKDLVREIWNRC